MSKISLVLLLCFLTLAASGKLLAGELEKLVMPGEVIKSHASFEADCDQCHQSFDKKKQNQSCLACHDHENIKEDISKSTGVHGRITNVRNIECSTCHTEHLGRQANVVNLVAATFDHSKTDFPLKGGHATQECKACHVADKKYHDAPVQCFSCHKKIEPHKTRLGKNCQDCHSEKSWSSITYDHDKETEYKLLGKHKDVPCDVCHVSQKYKDTPKQCYDCHYVNDIHNGSQGKKCESCHSEKNWSDVAFDHDKETKFSLKDSHSELSCVSCHAGGDFEKKLKTDCYSCHRQDDRHKSQYGNKCSSCHTEKEWKTVIFQHDRDTDYSLSGKHKKTACNDCHRPELKKMSISSDCYTCHKSDDVHKGGQGKICSQCHVEEGWNKKVIFDHDLTDFPLMGQHVVLPCAECHIDRQFSETKTECHVCHLKDDTHKGRFGRDCGNCHNPNDWNLWMFDHDTQTDFAIDGAHKELSCNQCHTRTGSESVRISRTCEGCHRSDDVHKGGFGRQCGQCHSNLSFSEGIKY